MKKLIFYITVLCISVLTAVAQDGRVINLTIHAASIEGNLVGDSPDLSVAVFLPTGYWLHGFTGWKDTTGKTGWNDDLIAAVSKLISSGSVKPMKLRCLMGPTASEDMVISLPSEFKTTYYPTFLKYS